MQLKSSDIIHPSQKHEWCKQLTSHFPSLLKVLHGGLKAVHKGKYTWWDFRWMESQTHQYINWMLVPIVYYSFKGFSIKYILFICWFGIIFEPHVFLTPPWQTMKYSWRQVIPNLVVSCACHHNIAVLIDSWRIVSCRMQKSRASLGKGIYTK